MTTAEQLRQALAKEMPFTETEFLATVAASIRKRGYYAMAFYPYPTTANGLNSGGYSEVHRNIIIGWAKDTGFRVIREFNCYGVPSYFIEL